MSVLIAILTLLLVTVVFLVVTGPLRRASRRPREQPAGEAAGEAAAEAPPSRSELRREELEAAREAKYREIRDAELDFRTGKLSREDYDAIDMALRAEALEILDQLERSRS